MSDCLKVHISPDTKQKTCLLMKMEPNNFSHGLFKPQSLFWKCTSHLVWRVNNYSRVEMSHLNRTIKISYSSYNITKLLRDCHTPCRKWGSGMTKGENADKFHGPVGRCQRLKGVRTSRMLVYRNSELPPWAFTEQIGKFPFTLPEVAGPQTAPSVCLISNWDEQECYTGALPSSKQASTFYMLALKRQNSSSSPPPTKKLSQ